MNLDPRPFPTPYLRRHRFHEAVANSGHKVFAIPPGTSTKEIPALGRMLIDKQSYDEGRIWQFDEAAQDWLDDLELETTPTIWTPDARYYLFDYVKPDRLAAAKCPVPGARLFNDCDWIPYPGSWLNGQLVHWEFEPCWFEKLDLPVQFWA